MTPRYQLLQAQLKTQSWTWLVTGASGFIGSNLVETLLGLGQRVFGLDNFATGKRENLQDVERQVCTRFGTEAWQRFTLLEGDITNISDCHAAVRDVDFVLHQAALGSVPRSIANPIATHQANVDGFLNMLVASQQAGVKQFVYASSSSVYGDSPKLPKIENEIGAPLSPYALTKSVNEQYADVFARTYGFATIGLRYFNVFGRRQDPAGAYAAVIPRWIRSLLLDETCVINGDGETSRDFCYVANVVQANLLAATATNSHAVGQVYNVAVGEQTSLVKLFFSLRDGLAYLAPGRSVLVNSQPKYGPFRAGDVRHSLASIEKACRLLGYQPTHSIEAGLAETLPWYAEVLAAGAAP